MINNKLYHKLLYFYFQNYIFDLPEYERENYIITGFINKLKHMVIALYLDLKEGLFRKTPRHIPILYKSNWVFLFGKNNYEATNFLAIDDFIFVSDRRRNILSTANVIQLPYGLRLRYFYKFILIYYFLWKMEGKKAYHLSNIIFNSIGWMEVFDSTIKKFKPKSITFSNDHSYIPRALLLMAKKNNVPTIYLQHATVTSSFPPLEYDLNLLEGQDAFDKYKSKGIEGIVKFIGMPRFDNFYRMRKKPVQNIRTIGFAFNTVDSIGIIYGAISAVIHEFPTISVVIRRHPKDKRDFKKLLYKLSERISFSNPLSEASFTFLLNCDLLIAGDSAIHLDACLLNVNSYYYNFAPESRIKDLYGFIKQGFVKELINLDDLFSKINKGLSGIDVFTRAKYYNSLIGTDMESQASQIARYEIREFLAR